MVFNPEFNYLLAQVIYKIICLAASRHRRSVNLICKLEVALRGLHTQFPPFQLVTLLASTDWLTACEHEEASDNATAHGTDPSHPDAWKTGTSRG